MLIASRWTRYGHDRLYVNDEAQVRVGWVDLLTGSAVLERGEYEAEFAAIVARHLQTPAAPVDEPPAPVDEPAAPVDEPAMPPAARDLTENRAGESLKLKAAEMRAEAPLKHFVARLLGARTDERAWRIGGKGEAQVGKVLSRLPAGWHVLHNVPVGEHDSDIDHVVIGPGGVFTLNTKHHPGGRVWIAEHTCMVNGQKTPYLRNSRFEAERAAKLLSKATGQHVHVEPVIVVVGARITRRADPEGVHVVAREAVTRWLNQRPAILTAQTVEAIVESARWSATWAPTRT